MTRKNAKSHNLSIVVIKSHVWHFPKHLSVQNHRYAPVQPLTLTRVDYPPATQKLVASETKILSTENFHIFLATINCEGYDEPAPAVCKIAFHEEGIRRLRNECGFYSKQLRKLQGDIVPFFYGLFEGSIGENLVVCLVTGYCGRSLPVPVYGMSWEYRVSLIEAVIQLHSAGVKHNELDEENILVDDNGRPVIVDFDLATAHECEQEMDVVFDDVEPDKDDFGCDEVHNICNLVRAWKPGHIRYLKSYRPLSLDPEVLANDAPDWVSHEVALAEARKAISDYEKYLERRDACDWTVSYYY